MIKIIGLFSAFLTTASFVPQAVKTVRDKDTKGISLAMYSMFAAGVLGWLIYGIMIKDIPIIMANVVTLVFASVILVMKLIYK